MSKQLSFIDKAFKKQPDCFGGSLLKGNNPNTKRPLESKLPIHLVLRAKRGGMRQPKIFGKVSEIVKKTSTKHGMRVYKSSNNGNHIHMAVKLSSVRRWPGFIRELCGRIASLMRENKVTEKGESYWLYRPYTRIVRSWKRAYKDLLDYIELNFLEAEGMIRRKETKTLKGLRAIWADP